MVKAIRSLSGTLGLLLAGVSAGQTLLLSVLPVMLSDAGLSTAVLGLILAAGTLSLIAAAPAWGRLGSRSGPLQALRYAFYMLTLAQWALVTAVVLVLYRSQATPVLVGLILAARAVQGAGAAGVFPAAQAWVAGRVPAETRLAALAQLSAANNSGRALGPVLVLLALPFGALAPLGWLLVLPLFGLLALHGKTAAAAAEAPRMVASIAVGAGETAGPKPWAALAVAGCTSFTLGHLQLLLGPVLNKHFALPVEAAAAVTAATFVVAALLSVLLQLNLLRRWSAARALRFGLLLLLMATLLESLQLHAGLAVIAAIGMAAGAACAAPSYSALASSGQPEAAHGPVFASLSMAHTAGYSAGFVIAGSVHATLPAWAWTGGLLGAVLAMSFAWRLTASVSCSPSSALAEPPQAS